MPSLRPALKPVALAAPLALLPTLAFAHTGVGFGWAGGLAHGLAHPLFGLDHLLAMVMVGVLACQLGGSALWRLPMTFVLVMAAGGVMGVAGLGLPLVETAVATSVVALGALVAFRNGRGSGAPLALAMALTAAFALFHGHAHGAEMPSDASGLAYALGFLSMTALLHAAGIGLGLGLQRVGAGRGPALTRAAGATTALLGVAILAGVL